MLWIFSTKRISGLDAWLEFCCYVLFSRKMTLSRTLDRNNDLGVDLKLLYSINQSYVDSWATQLGLCCKGDRGHPRLEPNRCALSFPTTNHNPVSKTLMDLKSLGATCPATVILWRTIKGHAHILSTVHWTSICLTLTPSTPTLLPVPHVQRCYLKPFIKAFPPKHGKVPHRSIHEVSILCSLTYIYRVWTK